MNALEMALEALTNPSTIVVSHAIELIRAELAKPEREWVGLTDDEINDFDKKLRDNGDYCSLHFAWGISAKLKEKNNAV